MTFASYSARGVAEAAGQATVVVGERPTTSPEAVELYLRGLRILHGRQSIGEDPRELLTGAVALAPDDPRE